jgi:hypothetical protein
MPAADAAFPALARLKYVTFNSQAAATGAQHVAKRRCVTDLRAATPESAVDELYRIHALGLVRLALLIVGDQTAAEDVVHDAFLGLCRGWQRLHDPGKAPGYLRVAVVNGCRSVLRSRVRARLLGVQPDPPVWSAEAAALADEDRRRMLAPLAAAAATAAVAIAGSIVLPALTANHAQPARKLTASTGATRVKSSGPAALPQFVVENDGGALQVVDTATWLAVGQLSAPTGQSFEAVAGAADDRTFVVAADLNPQTTCATWLYVVHLNSRGQPGTLSPLAPRAAGLPTSIAVSADGSTVAYSIVHCASGATGHIAASQPIGTIGVLNIASGQSRQWSFSLAEDYTSDLSLSGTGGMVGFSSYLDGVPAASSTTVGRVLSADAQAGTVLQRAQVLIRPAQAAYAGVDSVALSSDGHTMYACTNGGASAADMTQTVGAYDTATGNLTRVLRTWHAQDSSCAITADPAGGHLLLATAGAKIAGPGRGKHSTTNQAQARLLPAGHPYTVLRWIDLSTGNATTLPLRLPIGTSLAL